MGCQPFCYPTILISDNIKTLNLRGRSSSLFFQPDTAHINLQILPSSRPSNIDKSEGGTKLVPVQDAVSENLGQVIIHGKDLPDTVTCHLHLESEECMYDVECGWCTGSTGSFCVEGSAVGPCNQSIPCPVYTTYQQPGMGSHDCGTNTSPCDEPDVSDIFKPSAADYANLVPATPEFNPTINPVVQAPSTPNALSKDQLLDMLLGNSPVHEAPGAPKLTLAQTLAATAFPQGIRESIRINPSDVVIIDQEHMPSPCGLPGTSQMMCMDWVLKHCGGDHPSNDPSCDLALHAPEM